MYKISEVISGMRSKEKEYLRSGKVAIAKNNLRAMTILSAFGVIAVGIFWLYRLLVLKWTLPPVFLAPIPVFLVFFGISALMGMKNWNSIKLVSVLSIVYVIIQYACFYLLDVFTSDVTVSYFMPMVLIATAATFVFSSKTFNIINITTVAIYIFGVLMWKPDAPYAYQYDIFTILIALLVSEIVGTNFRLMQVGDYAAKSKYKSLSMRDPLLEDVYNKRGYEEAIKQYLMTKNPRVSCAFIILDLNDFKGINDNYGHDMGDNILRCMSGTLVSLFRDSDIIGRFGGDEFIVLADGLADEDAVEKKLKYISELIGQRAQEAGAIKVYSSLGAIICDNQKVDFEHLFKLADEAMYEAKEKVKRAVEKDGRNIDCFNIKHYVEADEKN